MGNMWVSVVLGFDPDGQLIAKWREAFQRHGELMREFTHREEYVKELRRHTMVSRLRTNGQEVLPPLADSVVRVAVGKTLNASGITTDGLFNKWRPQAWRMEILSLSGPAQLTAAASVSAVLSESSTELS
jgi:hypothetical protein